MNRRRMLLQSKCILPSGYKLCEYLESTGSQWIDTGIKPTDKYTVKLKAQTTSSATQYMYGINIEPYRFQIAQRSAGADWILDIQNSTGANRVATHVSGNTLSVLRAENKSFYVDDTLKGTSTGTVNVQIYNAYLFGVYGQSSKGIGRVYYLKVQDENNRLVQDLIPCLDNNNRPCMYDTVSKQTFYNQSTREFLYGPIIN